MGAGGCVVCCSGVSGSDTVTVINNLLNFTGRKCLFLFQTENLNFIVLILKNLQLFLIIQQIHTLSSIYLEHAHIKLYALFITCNLEDIVNCILGYCVYCESLTRTSLTVRKTSHNSILENHR